MAVKKSLKQIISDEYKRCSQDPIHFMRKYCIIQHPTKGKMLFNLYPFQEDSLTQLKENRYNIILKSRQLGISTLTAGYALWRMIFRSDFNVLVIATKQDVAKNLVTKVRVMNENLPNWLKGKTLEDNKLSLRYANGSQIKAISSKGDAGRSEALSLLIFDEAAFIDRIDEIWTAAQQTLATGGDCIALSTPNGVGNWFHRMWVDAEAGGEFNTIKLHWTVHPDRDEAWREKQTLLLGEKGAAQECDCDFISSGHTVVDGAILQWYADTHVKDPVEKRGMDSNFWIWEYADYNKNYMVVADVARGDSTDYSAFHVFDTETCHQVAEYKGKIGTTEYGNMLIAVATEYNNALLVIENANIGWASIQVALDKGYSNLYYSYKQDGYVDEDIHLRKGYDLKGKSKTVPGFSMTSRTRPLVISKLETYFRDKTPIVHSKRLIDELFTFVWLGHRAEAARGYNDDLVMSFSTGLWMRDTALRLQQQGMDLNRKALGHFGKSQGVYSANQQTPKEWQWKSGDGENSDLKWLL
tara:strand:+ start:37087 stop:38664 length:1578 start_codon:yes stop_codon:yes gene_type:complete